MSHELDDNIERRQKIISVMGSKGYDSFEVQRLIMGFGYNERGAREKLRELNLLRMIELRDGKWYAKK